MKQMQPIFAELNKRSLNNTVKIILCIVSKYGTSLSSYNNIPQVSSGCPAVPASSLAQTKTVLYLEFIVWFCLPRLVQPGVTWKLMLP